MNRRTGKADPRPRGPQVDKWGYLNNPRWAEKGVPIAGTGLTFGASGWNPNRHLPCGHWHKRGVYQKNIAVPHSCYQDVDIKRYTDKNGNEQIWCPFVLWMDVDPNGMLALVYDSGGRVWVDGVGMVYKDGTTTGENLPYDLKLGPGWSTVIWDWSYLDVWEYSSWPGYPFTDELAHYPTVKCIDENFWAFTSLGEGYLAEYPDDYHYWIHVWVVKDGVVTRRRVVSESTDYFWYRNEPNTLAIKPNGTIVTAAIEMEYDYLGTWSRDRAVVYVSNDYGSTWKKIVLLDVDAETDYLGDSIRVHATDDGNLYCIHDRHDYGQYLYRSVDDGNNWQLVKVLAIPAPPETPGGIWGIWWNFDVNDIYVCDPFYTEWIAKSADFYKSTDGGESFSYAIENLQLPSSANPLYWSLCGFGVRDEMWLATIDAYQSQDSGTLDGIWRSTDNGVTWTRVHQFFTAIDTLWWDWQNYRHDGDVWVWASAEYYRREDDLLAFMLSMDNGETWQVIKSPVSFSSSFTYVPVYSLEPQVWTLPFGNGYSNNL